MKNIGHSSVSQKRLRELARRALRVVERRQGLDPNVATVSSTLVPAAEAFIKAYDEGVKAADAQVRRMAQGRESIAELDQRLRGCLAIVRYASPDFDVSEMDGTVNRPDRLIANAWRVLELLSQAGPSIQPEVLDLLRKAVEKADALWTEAQTARATLQDKQSEVRALAIALNCELIPFRSILRAFLGAGHVDYKNLRASRTASPEDDEDDTVEEEPEPEEVTTSPLGNSTNGHPATNGTAANNRVLSGLGT